MKQYDHEPTIEELCAQLVKEDAFLPDFLPKFMNYPIIRSIIGVKAKEAMVSAMVQFFSF